MKKFLALILAFCLLFMLGGCEKDNSEEEIEPDVTEEPVPEPTPYPLFIGDIEITRSPTRVVSLSPSLTEIIHELGYGARIIGRSNYCDFPFTIQQMPALGSSANPDIDKIISLSPYMVLTTSPLSAMDMFRMEQEGIKTLIIPASESLTQLRYAYRALGLVFEGAFTGLESGDNAFSEISQTCDNKSVVNIGSFVYITGDFKAATGDTLESSVFSCFGENIAKGGRNYEFDFELLSQNQPDVILLNNIYTLNDLLTSEYINELNAVWLDRIIFIDNTVFEKPSSRLVLMIEKMLADYNALQ